MWRKGMKELQLRVRVVVKTSNLKFHVVVWQIRQRIAAQSVSHVQHDDFSSFGQSRYWFLWRRWYLNSVLCILKLPVARGMISANHCLGIIEAYTFLWWLTPMLRATRARGLFLGSPENFLDPKSQLSNCFPLVLKTWPFNLSYKGNCITRNRLEKFWDFWETGPRYIQNFTNLC